MFAFLLVGCAKDLPEKMPEALQETAHSIGNLEGAVISLVTSGNPSVDALTEEEAKKKEASEPQDLLNLQENGLVKVVGATGPTEFLQMFDDLSIPGKSNTSYSVKLKVIKSQYLVAYIVVNTSELSSTQAVIAEGNLVPIFYYDIKDVGVLRRKLNDLDEETRTVEFKPTDDGNATHVKINLMVKNRKLVGIQSVEDDTLRELYSKNSFDQQITLAKNLQKKLGKQIESLSDLRIVKTEIVRNGSLLVKVFKQKSELTEDELEILSGSSENIHIQECNDVEKEKVIALGGSLSDGCYFTTAYQMAVDFVDLEKVVEKQDLGIATPKLKVVPSRDFGNATVIQIKGSTSFTFFSPDTKKDPSFLATKFSLPVKYFKGKEFLFRRVLVDSPNTFNYTFAGAAGGLEIVKFVFDSDSVEVKKSKPGLDKPGTTDVDEEVLMRIPVYGYYRLTDKDMQGRPLGSVQYIRTWSGDPQATAIINWEGNSIPNINSPLDYFSLGQCFGGVTDKEIEKVALDEDAGSFNFTLATSYVANPKAGCVNVFSGYFDSPTQTQLTFKERVSFKEYKAVKNEADSFGGDIPYEGQKKMGYGLFTYSKTVPDKFGGTSTIGTKQYLPAIFDIKDDKQIEYVLAGMPSLLVVDPREKLFDPKELREELIKSTAEVFEDLNDGFRASFKGTGFRDSEKDVIAFKLEKDETFEDMIEKFEEGADNGISKSEGTYYYKGIALAEAKEMGDLERNYVYYVEKQTNSSIIGLGGSHANPRNGKVESASIYLYGGNMRSMIKSFRLLEKAKVDYEKLTNPKNYKSLNPSEDKKGEGKVAEETDPDAEGELDSGGGEKGNGNEDLAGHFKEQLIKIIANMNSVEMKSDKMTKEQYDAAMSKHIKAFERKVDSEEIGFILNDIIDRNLGHSNTPPSDELYSLQEVRNSIDKKSLPIIEALNIALEKAKASNAFTNEHEVQELFSGVLLRHDAYQDTSSNKLVGDEFIEAIESNKIAKAWYKKVHKNLESRNICLYQGFNPAKAVTAAGKSISDMSDLEIFFASWKPTVAHEVGHNLGLRHNFISSFDKANWKFSSVEDSKRTYSSVMDYLVDDHLIYDGLGPYDIHALRAAYTGLVELAPQALAFAKAKSLDNLNGAKIYGEKFIKVADYPKAIGANSWFEVTKRDTAVKLPIKGYKFCSDDEAGQYPTCNRFDYGTTAVEIVDFKIQNYRERYSLRNFPHDKLRFNSETAGGYIGSLFSTFTGLRQFLEEFFFQAMFERPLSSDPASAAEFQARLQDYFQAAYKGYQFLQGVVRTPDVASYVSVGSNQRFVPIKMTMRKRNPDGSTVEVEVPVVAETKFAKNQGTDTTHQRLKVRGVEFDRVIALIIMTQSNLGFPRYLRRSLVVNYPMFEKFVLGVEIKDSEVVNLLKEILRGDLTPSVTTSEGFNLPLSFPYYKDGGKPFVSDISEMLRNYAVIGSISNLDIQSFEPGLNPSRAFRILSDMEAPEKAEYVTKQDGDIKYWSFSGSTASDALIKAGHFMRVIEESGIKELLGEWVNMEVTTLGQKPTTMNVAYDEILLSVNLGKRKTAKEKLVEINAKIKEIMDDFSPEKIPALTILNERKEKQVGVLLFSDEIIRAQVISLLSKEGAPEGLVLDDKDALALLEEVEGEIFKLVREKLKSMASVLKSVKEGSDPEKVKKIKALVITMTKLKLTIKGMIAVKVDAVLKGLVDPGTKFELSTANLGPFLISDVLQNTINIAARGNYSGKNADVYNLSTKYAKLSRSIPVLGYALSLLDGANADVYLPQADAVFNVSVIDSVKPADLSGQQYSIISNIKMLSNIFISINPEYKQ